MAGGNGGYSRNVLAEETFASTRLDEAEMTIHTCCQSERRAVMELGQLGVWVGMDGMSAAAAAAFAERVEERGYGALWIPEGRGPTRWCFRPGCFRTRSD